VQDSDRLFPRVKDPPGWAPCFSLDGSSPRRAEPIKRGVPPLSEETFPLPWSSWRLCMFWWRSPYTRTRRVGVQYSRTFLLGVRECLWPIEPGPTWHGSLGTRWLWCLPSTKEPSGREEGVRTGWPDGKILFAYGRRKKSGMIHP
jgi:hypothetical protein